MGSISASASPSFDSFHCSLQSSSIISDLNQTTSQNHTLLHSHQSINQSSNSSSSLLLSSPSLTNPRSITESHYIPFTFILILLQLRGSSIKSRQLLNAEPISVLSIPLSFSSPFFPVDLRATYLSAARASHEQLIRKGAQLCYCYRRPLLFFCPPGPYERIASFCAAEAQAMALPLNSLSSLTPSLSLHLPTKVKNESFTYFWSCPFGTSLLFSPTGSTGS